MIIIDRVLQQRERDGNPINVGMIGAGFMGRGLANTIINATPGMRLAAVANRHLANARRAYEELGITELAEVDDAQGVERAISQGIPAVTENPYALTRGRRNRRALRGDRERRVRCPGHHVRDRERQAHDPHECRARRDPGTAAAD